MPSMGRIREWHRDVGWGVVDSDDMPGVCWTHFSHAAVGTSRYLQMARRFGLNGKHLGKTGTIFGRLDSGLRTKKLCIERLIAKSLPQPTEASCH